MKVEYKLTGTWMAPTANVLVSGDDLKVMLENVISEQARLSGEFKNIDMTTNKGHSTMLAATNVSWQLRSYRAGVESAIRYDEGVGGIVNDKSVYTSPLSHRSTKSNG